MVGHPPSDNTSIFGKGVAVMFPGNKGSVCCFLTSLSRAEQRRCRAGRRSLGKGEQGSHLATMRRLSVRWR